MGKRIEVGMLVEFESAYGPGTPVKTRRGRVTHVGSYMFPSNPVILAECGQIEVLATQLRIIVEGPDLTNHPEWW